MAPALRYPSAVLLGLSWLRESLPGPYGHDVVIAARVPNPRPAGAMVIISRTGGVPDRAFRDRPRLDAMCWHDDEASAEGLALVVLPVLLSARGQVVEGVTIGVTTPFMGLVSTPDPDSQAPRYLLTVEWQVPGVPL